MTQQVTLVGNMFSVRKDEDQSGEEGPWLAATDYPGHELGQDKTIVVGKRLLVGSVLGPYILLSTVQEILEVNEEKTVCRIRTRNSVYTIKSF